MGKQRMIFIAITLCDSIIAYIRRASLLAEKSVWRISQGARKKSLESKIMDTINWMLELKNNQAPKREAETTTTNSVVRQKYSFFLHSPPFTISAGLVETLDTDSGLHRVPLRPSM